MMTGSVRNPTSNSTKEYGSLFEQFVINEIRRTQEYKKTYQENYYLRTDDSQEIDLIVEGNGKIFLVEIKSTTRVKEEDIKFLKKINGEMKNSIAICIAQEKVPRTSDGVVITDFQSAIEIITE